MPERGDLLGRARALIPSLQERAERTEELRLIPPETIRDLAELGLLRVANPKRYGGYGFDVDLFYEVVTELARGCGSTAWCYSVWLAHNWMVGHWPERLQEEYFAGGPDTLSSSGFAPSGKLEPQEDGFKLSGRWDFSSGCDAATWALLGANSPTGPAYVMVPREDYRVIDTWFAAGLKGTGSKDIQVSNAFVPKHRMITFRDLAIPPAPDLLAPRTPAWELHGLPSYRLPMMNVVSFAISCPVVGMAQGALDCFEESLRGKSGPGRTADSVSIQMRFAEASAETEAARVTTFYNLKELLERSARGESMSVREFTGYQRNRIFAARLAVQAITRLFEVGGAHSVYASQALQRYFRDAVIASHHTSLNWDNILEQYGSVALRG
jgi:3-hydroxy-9,10-secoandrosta-1,3,5(10)-triene-9,17-dione monooxygenase